MASVTVTRTFEFPGYVNLNGVLFAEPLFRQSVAFSGGGYDWCLIHTPDYNLDMEQIGLELWLTTIGARVTASVNFAILDAASSLPPWNLIQTSPEEFSSDDRSVRVFDISIPKIRLHESPGLGYVTRRSFLFHGTITVFTEMPPSVLIRTAKIPLASDMMEQLAKIYASEDGCDVTFLGGEKQFRAHKIILSMRSPVFKRELYGQMMESKAQLIEIKDMLPDVFEALLRYIYTDTLPTTASGQEDEGMICGLLVAADLYDVHRLKLLCERELCKALRVDNVAKMVAFAEDHHCNILSDACIEFFATSGTMDLVEASDGYAELRSKRLLTLVEVYEKANKRFRRE